MPPQHRRGGFFHTVLRQPSSRRRKVASSADAVLKDCTVSARPSGAMSTAPSPATPSRRRRTVCPSGDPVAAIRRCKGKLGYFHLADNSRWYPGSGQLDFKKQFEALEEIGYDGYLSIECFPRPTHEEAAARGIQYVRDILGA